MNARHLRNDLPLAADTRRPSESVLARVYDGSASVAVPTGAARVVDSSSNELGPSTVTVSWTEVGPMGQQCCSGTRLGCPTYSYDGDAGLVLARARVIDPMTGLFLQRDPEGFVDSVNVYAAMANDPINNRDPTGRGIIEAIMSLPVLLSEGPAVALGFALRAAENDGALIMAPLDPLGLLGFLRPETALNSDASTTWAERLSPGHQALRSALEAEETTGFERGRHRADAARAQFDLISIGLGTVVSVGQGVEAIKGARSLLVDAFEEAAASMAREASGRAGSGSPLSSTPNAAEQLVTIYRGVWRSHPNYPAALEGRAVPWGGAATPEDHTLGDTESNFTSWTTARVVAETKIEVRGEPGVILEIRLPRSRFIISQNAFPHEAEVLLEGVVRGAMVVPFVPRP
jgi:RHS repeat-associated protein